MKHPLSRREFVRKTTQGFTAVFLSPWLYQSASVEELTSDWPMLAHDSARSGATPIAIHPPFERKWYRLFTDEGIQSGVQPIISQRKLFIGTLHSILHAINTETGQDEWTYPSGGPILHTCAVDSERVYFGSINGNLYAIWIGTGQLAWQATTGSAIWNSPLIHDHTVYIGSRDGYFYAFDTSGFPLWKTALGAPILCSPALDAQRKCIYVGSEDMQVHALNIDSGEVVWRSSKLPGTTMRGYHPVIAPDGSVLITTAPFLSLDTVQEILLNMVKEVFGDFASWRHSKEENDRIREENFTLLEKSETYQRQIDYLRRCLTNEPYYQTFFVLDPDNGKPKFVTPIVYAESMNGVGAPAVVTPDGKVIVKYSALLRSRYEHYSPFLNVGYLDTATGDITPIMDQTRTYGWHDSLLLVHDEQSQLMVSGNLLINTHQNDINAMNLDTREGLSKPFAYNIHEPKPGEALATWLMSHASKELPQGKEWIARGMGVYGGGSVMDTGITVAGDSFYYLPTHELNSGVALIAYKMDPNGTSSQQSEMPMFKLSTETFREIHEQKWDWDILDTPRLKHVLDSFAEPVPGTKRNPLYEEADKRLKSIKDEELESQIWDIPSHTPSRTSSDIYEKLEFAVEELLSHEWQPWLFPAGKHPMEAYRYFMEPTETLYTLALAFPHLSPEMQGLAKTWVSQMSETDGPLSGPVGQKAFDPHRGENRAAYDLPPENLVKIQNDILRSDLARLYPIWLWSSQTGDSTHIEHHWENIRSLLNESENKFEEDGWNGRLAGLIALARMAKDRRDSETETAAAEAFIKLARKRLRFEWAHTRGGLIFPVPNLRTTMSRWRHITPDIGRMLAAFTGKIHSQLMHVYVDYHRPTWPLAWNVETLWRNESPFGLPTMPMEIFSACAWILNYPSKDLTRFIDIPWCKADLYYIQKLAMTLNAQSLDRNG